MKSYEKEIEDLGFEIADDMIRKQEDPNWEITLNRDQIARSLAMIYDKAPNRVSRDLEDSIKKATRRIRERKDMNLYN